MAASLIDVIKENVRQAATGDDAYFKSEPYYFKLVRPVGGSGGSSFGEAIFPLPIAPDRLDYEMPFAAELTPMQEGGVLVDESGIVIARLQMEGTTGFKLRKSKDTSFDAGDPKWTGQLPYIDSFGFDLSGQMQLWRLLGRCFDAYGELKKDPELAHEVSLEWHNLKDQIHQVVVPKMVRVERNAQRNRVTYRYRIECEVIGEAERNILDEVSLEDDYDVIQGIKDGVATIRSTVRQIAAAVDDITAAFDDISRFVSNLTGLIDDIVAIQEAGENLVGGVTSFLNLPKKMMDTISDSLDTACDELNAASGSLVEVHQVYRLMRDIQDHAATMQVAAYASRVKSFDARAQTNINKTQRFGNLTNEQRDDIDAMSAEAVGAGGNMRMTDAFGGNYRAGDATRRDDVGDQQPNLKTGRYQGYREVRVKEGDTIESIAIRHTGRVSAWQDIAVANQLRPPFISNSVRVPGTLMVGDPIVVPRAGPTAAPPIIHTGNPAAGGSHAETLLGRDFRLVQLASGKWGWIIDTGHGSVDIQTVLGVQNLTQALGVRCRTEKGSDLTFPSVGIARMVGNKPIGDNWREARFSLQTQVLADPRIKSISGMNFSIEADVLTVEVNAIPIGFDSSRAMPLVLT